MGRLDKSNPMTFRFNDFEVDPQLREVRHRGSVIPAQPKVFELLVYLLENRDRIINRQELRQTVWVGGKVSAATLATCIGRARRLVGDHPKQQRIIKTIHGNGYRFVATVEAAPELELAESISQLTENYPQALTAVNRLSVAVLPFRDFAENPEHEYFSEGFAEDIISKLSRFSSLFVTSPQTTQHFKDSLENPRDLARRLGVAYMVQGSIRRSKSRIRLTVHLIEASSDRRIWSESYDRELQDIPMIHDDVTRTIAATIGGRVEVHRDRNPFDSDDVKVYDTILRAKSLHHKDSKAANNEARCLLEQVISIAPNNAFGYTWLAAVHANDSWYRWTAKPEESMRLAVEFSSKALSLDDTEAVIHRNYAEIMDYWGEFALCETHLGRALELDPNDTTARGYYALLLVYKGRREEALQHMAVANRLDPCGHSWTPWANGVLNFAIGRYGKAIDWFSKLANSDNLALPMLAVAWSKQGDLDRARSVLEQFMKNACEDIEVSLGNDEEAWIEYLSSDMIFEGERSFEDAYDALLKAGWRELLNTLPELSDDNCSEPFINVGSQ